MRDAKREVYHNSNFRNSITILLFLDSFTSIVKSISKYLLDVKHYADDNFLFIILSSMSLTINRNKLFHSFTHSINICSDS